MFKENKHVNEGVDSDLTYNFSFSHRIKDYVSFIYICLQFHIPSATRSGSHIPRWFTKVIKQYFSCSCHYIHYFTQSTCYHGKKVTDKMELQFCD